MAGPGDPSAELSGSSRTGVRNRVWILRLGLLASLAFAGASVMVTLGPWRNPRPPAASRLMKASVTVAPGVFMLGSLSPSAVYVIESSDGLTLIDSGLAADAAPVRAGMAELGLDPMRVKRVCLTHAHGDHTGGAEWFRKNTGATIHAGKGDAGVLRAGGPREAFFSTYDMPEARLHATQVDVELSGTERIALGEAFLEAIAAPGHTPGSMCYLLEQRGQRIFFAGDVIMMLRGDEPPRDELGKPLGTYSAYLAPRYRGDAAQTLATLERLLRIPAPDLVLPGHPRADNRPQDPHIGPERWRALIQAGVNDMKTLLARYEADGRDFLDGEPREILPGLLYLGELHEQAIYVLRDQGKLFLIDAPGGEDLPVFLTERLGNLRQAGSDVSGILLTSLAAEQTAGLRALLARSKPALIAPDDLVPRLRDAIPAGAEILASSQLALRFGIHAKTIALAKLGTPCWAYSFDWGGKRVLCTGAFLTKVNQAAAADLAQRLGRQKDRIQDFFLALQRLHDTQPDLWLPSHPVHAQNANLYSLDWERVIEDNLKVLTSMILAQRANPG